MAYYWNSTFSIKPGAKRLRAKRQIKRGGKLKRSSLKRSPRPMNKIGRRGKRDSPKLVKWRREVRQRDNYTCQYPGCGKHSKRIDVHHIAKKSERPDLKFEASNGVCLCREHHDWTDTDLQKAIALGLRNIETYELAKKQKAA